MSTKKAFEILSKIEKPKMICGSVRKHRMIRTCITCSRPDWDNFKPGSMCEKGIEIIGSVICYYKYCQGWYMACDISEFMNKHGSRILRSDSDATAEEKLFKYDDGLLRGSGAKKPETKFTCPDCGCEFGFKLNIPRKEG